MVRKLDIVTTISSSWRVPYLENSLRALSCQTGYGDDEFRVIIVCVHHAGSPDIVLSDALSGMVAGKSWGFDIIKKECYLAFENDMFPLSLSRNIGARIATGDIIGFLDCDVIADPMTLSGVFQTVTVSESAALSIVYRMPHIPDHEIYRYLDVNSFRKNRTIGTLEIKGRGGCFFIDRELLFRIRGYDERLVGWGYEDDDMMIRLYRMGKYPYNMSKLDIIAMHQHHATAANAKHTWRMNHRVSAVSLDVVRNPRTWGGEPG